MRIRELILKVLKNNRWLKIQTPDMYVGLGEVKGAAEFLRTGVNGAASV